MRLTFILLLVANLSFGQSQRISDMPSATSLTGSELVPIVQTINKKATVSLLRGWGSIGSVGQSLRVNSGGTGLEFYTPGSGTIGGSTGSTDNAVLRADGTVGSTLQSSAMTVSDLSIVEIVGNSTNAATIRLYEDTDNGTNYSGFTVGSQGNNINYTLPTTASPENGYILSSNTGSVLSWVSRARSTITGDVLSEYTTATANNYKAIAFPIVGAYAGGSSITSIQVGVIGGVIFTANSMLVIKVTYSGVQTSGTAGSTAYCYTFESVWRQTASGTVTQVGSTVYQTQVNDTGDSWVTVPNVIYSGGTLLLTRNLTTTKTFNEQCYVEAFYVK